MNVTPEETQAKIAQLKWELKKTDYMTLKHAEGVLPDAEWEIIKAQRQAWRVEIEELKQQLENE